MKATIQLTEAELRTAISEWLRREYGISVNATNDISMMNYAEEWLGDPQNAPVYPVMLCGAEISVPNTQLKKKSERGK